MNYLGILMRWMHLLPAIALVGGSIFMLVAYFPASQEVESDTRYEFWSAIRKRWARIVMFCVMPLLVSGVVNMLREMKTIVDGDKSYHMLLGIKLLLAFAVFFLCSVLAGRSKLAEKFRQKERMWLSINAAIAITLVCIAGVMKNVPRSHGRVDQSTTTSRVADDSSSESQ